eukprot:COSAG02_NODE_21284_length_794_cov_5.234532_1_plen_141_part_00
MHMVRLPPPGRRSTLILLTPDGDGVWYGPTAIAINATPVRPCDTFMSYLVTISRRRRHWTFEVDIGNTKHHNLYHLSRLTPYFGDDSEGEPVDAFPEPEPVGPSTSSKKSYKVERIVGHRGQRGAAGYKYLIEWKYLTQI